MRAVITGMAMLAAAGLQAAESCSFKWDTSREVALYHTAPTTANAAPDAAAAPSISAGKLYALALQPQDKVQYLMAPSKKMLADGAYGGLLRLRVERAGHYRLAIDSGYWLDVVHDGRQLAAVDFNGSATCDGPKKIVVYDLPAGAELMVQLAAATGPQARLAITPVAATPP